MNKIPAVLSFILIIILFYSCNKTLPTEPSYPGAYWVNATADAAFGKRVGHTSLVYDNKMWVMCGGNDNNGVCSPFYNDCFYSTNGIDWLPATLNAAFGPRYYQTGAVFDDGSGEKMWIIGGVKYAPYISYNDVWYSTNGADWSLATGNAGFSPREYQTTVVFDGKIWVIGGRNYASFLNDVWYSANGADWYQATGNAAFSAREGHSSVVYDNKMWVIGGYSGGIDGLNDVWYSTNGADWYEATGNANFNKRRGQTNLVYDGKMWLLCGNENDVWNTTDGISWQCITASSGFTTIWGDASVVFDNKMWIIAGYTVNNGSHSLNEVWWAR